MPNLNFFYLQNNLQNFGDCVNIRFWQEIIGQKITTDYSKCHFLSTGSIMGRCNKQSIVCGAGFICENQKIQENPKQIYWVRGQLTREKLLELGVSCPKKFGDPLMILPCLYQNLSITTQKNLIGVLPHYIDKKSKSVANLINFLKRNGKNVRVINIQCGQNYEELINSILECDTIISSTLHGVIISIVYGKNVIYKKFGNRVHGGDFKFNDFFSSIGVKYNSDLSKNRTIFENKIDYSFQKVRNVSKNIIDYIPFINNKRKTFLKFKIDSHYNNFSDA